MKLEFHQLDRRWDTCESAIHNGGSGGCWHRCSQADRYLVIDGYKRIAALQQLGRDIVKAVVWPMSEAEALLLDRSLRLSEQETALEQGWAGGARVGWLPKADAMANNAACYTLVRRREACDI